MTSVIVTHDLQLCFSISDRVVLLHEGRFVEAGGVERFRASAHPAVMDFIDGGGEGEGRIAPSSM